MLQYTSESDQYVIVGTELSLRAAVDSDGERPNSTRPNGRWIEATRQFADARGELIELLRNNTYDWELPA